MSIRFAAIGLSHNHIYNQAHRLLEALAEVVVPLSQHSQESRHL